MGRTPNRASNGEGWMLADVMAERESKTQVTERSKGWGKTRTCDQDWLVVADTRHSLDQCQGRYEQAYL